MHHAPGREDAEGGESSGAASGGRQGGEGAEGGEAGSARGGPSLPLDGDVRLEDLEEDTFGKYKM